MRVWGCVYGGETCSIIWISLGKSHLFATLFQLVSIMSFVNLWIIAVILCSPFTHRWKVL